MTDTTTTSQRNWMVGLPDSGKLSISDYYIPPVSDSANTNTADAGGAPAYSVDRTDPNYIGQNWTVQGANLVNQMGVAIPIKSVIPNYDSIAAKASGLDPTAYAALQMGVQGAPNTVADSFLSHFDNLSKTDMKQAVKAYETFAPQELHSRAPGPADRYIPAIIQGLAIGALTMGAGSALGATAGAGAGAGAGEGAALSAGEQAALAYGDTVTSGMVGGSMGTAGAGVGAGAGLDLSGAGSGIADTQLAAPGMSTQAMNAAAQTSANAINGTSALSSAIQTAIDNAPSQALKNVATRVGMNVANNRPPTEGLSVEDIAMASAMGIATAGATGALSSATGLSPQVSGMAVNAAKNVANGASPLALATSMGTNYALNAGINAAGNAAGLDPATVALAQKYGPTAAKIIATGANVKPAPALVNAAINQAWPNKV